MEAERVFGGAANANVKQNHGIRHILADRGADGYLDHNDPLNLAEECALDELGTGTAAVSESVDGKLVLNERVVSPGVVVDWCSETGDNVVTTIGQFEATPLLEQVGEVFLDIACSKTEGNGPVGSDASPEPGKLLLLEGYHSTGVEKGDFRIFGVGEGGETLAGVHAGVDGESILKVVLVDDDGQGLLLEGTAVE